MASTVSYPSPERRPLTVTRLGDVPEALLAAGRVLPWHQPDGYYGPEESMRPDDVFPEITDEQVELREDARTKHQANVDAIKRRGLHDRVVSKLDHWMALEAAGYPLDRGDRAEVELLQAMLAEVREEMEAAGQSVGDYALLTVLGPA